MTAAWSLQKAMFAALGANVPLTTLLGGQRIYDDVPVRSEFPFVTFAQSSERDWSAGSEPGEEHTVTLHVWSRAAGRKEIHQIMGALRSALHDQPMTLEAHRLINLRHEFSEARRDADGDTYHGVVRLRAVTEPLS